MSQESYRAERPDSVVDAAREGYSTPRSPLTADDGRSVGEIISDITGNLTTLLHQEVALAKAEVRETGVQAGKGMGLLSGAGVASQLVLVFVSVGAWWGLGQSIGMAWSALVVAAFWAVVALILFAMGRRELQRIRGVEQTTQTLREIPNAFTGNEEDKG